MVGELISMPKISAKAWVIADFKSGIPLWGVNEHTLRPIASLTKICTAYVVNKILTANPQMRNSGVHISKHAQVVGGTSAKLVVGDYITVHNLLYAMLLPSGNDAAMALAEHFGMYLDNCISELSVTDEEIIKKSVQTFVDEMNKQMKLIGAHQSHFKNPHGMDESGHMSTAADMSLMAAHAMQDAHFRTIVSSTSYSARIENTISGVIKFSVWTNTNKFLYKDKGVYTGVKTGTTNGAGFCLCTSGGRKYDSAKAYIITVLACHSNGARYPETSKLFRWVHRARIRGLSSSCLTAYEDKLRIRSESYTPTPKKINPVSPDILQSSPTNDIESEESKHSCLKEASVARHCFIR